MTAPPKPPRCEFRGLARPPARTSAAPPPPSAAPVRRVLSACQSPPPAAPPHAPPPPPRARPRARDRSAAAPCRPPPRPPRAPSATRRRRGPCRAGRPTKQQNTCFGRVSFSLCALLGPACRQCTHASHVARASIHKVPESKRARGATSSRVHVPLGDLRTTPWQPGTRLMVSVSRRWHCHSVDSPTHRGVKALKMCARLCVRPEARLPHLCPCLPPCSFCPPRARPRLTLLLAGTRSQSCAEASQRPARPLPRGKASGRWGVLHLPGLDAGAEVVRAVGVHATHVLPVELVAAATRAATRATPGEHGVRRGGARARAAHAPQEYCSSARARVMADDFAFVFARQPGAQFRV